MVCSRRVPVLTVCYRVFPAGVCRVQCERLALMDQSYSEDAGQRCSLVLGPELPASTAGAVYSQLHGQLERTFELFLAASEVRQLPQLPQYDDPSYISEVRDMRQRSTITEGSDRGHQGRGKRRNWLLTYKQFFHYISRCRATVSSTTLRDAIERMHFNFLFVSVVLSISSFLAPISIITHDHNPLISPNIYL